MSRVGLPRRKALVGLVPPGGTIVDVGADHGYVAEAVGAIATEREPHRAGNARGNWVICDGLAAFSRVDTAIIAGMGVMTILGILERGPLPHTLVAHAQDDPPKLRQCLAQAGWRIDAEALAPEAGRYAEVLRAVRGDEPSSGLELEFGPRLRERGDPHLVPHLTDRVAYYTQLATQTRDRSMAKHQWAAERAAYLTVWLRQLTP